MSEFWLYQIPGVLMVLAIVVIIGSWLGRQKSTPGAIESDQSAGEDPVVSIGGSVEEEMSPKFHKLLLQQIVQKDNLLKLLGLQTRNLTNQFEGEDEAVKAALAVMVEEPPRLEETSPEWKDPKFSLSNEGFKRLNEMIVVRDRRIRELQLHIKGLKTKIEEREKNKTIQ